jgi:hypothetical protein
LLPNKIPTWTTSKSPPRRDRISEHNEECPKYNSYSLTSFRGS